MLSTRDSILTNVINPVIEAIQGLAPDGYRIMVATHASQKPPDGESGMKSFCHSNKMIWG